MPETTQIEAVITSLKIIECLAYAAGPMRISEVATELGVPRPRVFRQAPVFEGAGVMAGTVSYLGSVEDLPGDPPEHLLSTLMGTAAKMSAQLGFKRVLMA